MGWAFHRSIVHLRTVAEKTVEQQFNNTMVGVMVLLVPAFNFSANMLEFDVDLVNVLRINSIPL